MFKMVGSLRVCLIIAFTTKGVFTIVDGVNVSQQSFDAEYGLSHLVGQFTFIHAMEHSEDVRNNMTKACRLDVNRTIHGFNTFQSWAMRMVDAAGSAGNGMLHPPIRLLGHKDECEDITATDELAQQVVLFRGKYCRLDAHVPNLTAESLESTVMLGICVPDSCTEDDTRILVVQTINDWMEGISTREHLQVSCFHNKTVDSDFVIVVCVISIIVSMSVLGTFYDLVFCRMHICRTGLFLKSDKVLKSFRNLFVGTSKIPYYRSDESSVTVVTDDTVMYINGGKVIINHSGKISDDGRARSKSSTGKPKSGILHSADIAGKDTLYLIDNEVACNDGIETEDTCAESDRAYEDEDESRHVDDSDAANSGKSTLDNMHPDLVLEVNTNHNTEGKTVKNRINDVVVSFSLVKNIQQLVDTSQVVEDIEHIHGIRVISMAWVILGQTLALSHRYTDNILRYYGNSKKHWTFMAFESSINATDTFFVISGMLLAYQTLKALDKGMGDNKLNLLYFYLHKVWRLTPTYMIVLAIGTIILPYCLTGPLSTGSLQEMASCKLNWWKHVLYINNYAEHPPTLCMAWTWYLACTMQFFMISPLLLFVLYKYYIIGLITCGIMMLVCVMLRALISIHFNFGINIHSLLTSGALDEYEHHMVHPAHTRLASFVMGILVGYFIWRWKRDFSCPKKCVIVGWTISLVLTGVVVFGGHYYHRTGMMPPQPVSDVIHALKSTVWSLAIAWIIFACTTNNGGWINTLLSWKLFIPLSRLTYCVFLVHPLVILLYNENNQTIIHVSHYELVYMFLGNLVLSYAAALIVYLLFEIPFRTLEKRMFR